MSDLRYFPDIPPPLEAISGAISLLKRRIYLRNTFEASNNIPLSMKDVILVFSLYT